MLLVARNPSLCRVIKAIFHKFLTRWRVFLAPVAGGNYIQRVLLNSSIGWGRYCYCFPVLLLLHSLLPYTISLLR